MLVAQHHVRRACACFPAAAADRSADLVRPSRAPSSTLPRRKTRLLLNFKRISYRESLLSYPDIADALKSDRFPSYDGPFTLPAVCPPAGVGASADADDGICPALVDSFPIARALDQQFPSDRQVFPDQASLAFAMTTQALVLATVRPAGLNLFVRYIPRLLDARGAEYFVRTRTQLFGKPLDQVGTPGDRAKDVAALVDALKPFTAALRGDGPGGRNSPFLMGGALPTYADLIVVGILVWAHCAELAAGADVEPKGGWFNTLLEADGGGLGRLWVASKEWIDGQGEVVEWTGSA